MTRVVLGLVLEEARVDLGVLVVQAPAFGAIGDVAMAVKRSPSISTVTCGWATRLWYQDGWVGAPPIEATMTIRSPSRE